MRFAVIDYEKLENGLQHNPIEKNGLNKIECSMSDYFLAGVREFIDEYIVLVFDVKDHEKYSFKKDFLKMKGVEG